MISSAGGIRSTRKETLTDVGCWTRSNATTSTKCSPSASLLSLKLAFEGLTVTMGPSSSFNSIRSTPERESSTLQETLTIPLFRASRSLGVAKERLGAVKSTRNEEFVQGPHVIPSERRTLQYQSPSSRESACHSVVVEDTVPLECAIVPKDASRLKSIWKETCRSPSGSDELHLSTGVSTATHDSFAGSRGIPVGPKFS